MKHTLLPLFLILISLLTGCAKGDVSNVEKIFSTSAAYTHAEIESAMEVAIAHFRKEFNGCTLTEIRYEESRDAAGAEWAQTYGAKEGIVLLSSFDVDSSGGDGSLNPDSTYHNWQWVLVRSNDGAWELKTWGYG